MWKIGDMITSDVTYHGTVYEVIDTKRDSKKQVVRVAIDGKDLGGWFGSDLFVRWTAPFEDTRSYLDAVTNYVERDENEKVS